MKAKMVSLSCLLCIVSLLPLWGASTASAASVRSGKKAHAEVGGSVDRLTAGLKKRGFEIRRGDFQLWTIEDCPQSFEVIGTCYFNNPAAPYVMAVVPHWPDEFVDPATEGAFGPTEPGYGVTFRFDPNEAIVIFGYLPPKAAYFGIQSYLFTQKGKFQTDNDTYNLIAEIGAEDVFFHTLPADSKRIEIGRAHV